MQAPPAGASMDLCKSCGLCCSGALYDFVPVDEGEQERLTKLGFSPRHDVKTGMRFDHPCPRFSNGRCSVYEERPQACRRFRCELLIGFEKSDVTAEEARAVIDEAKALIEETRLLLGEDGPLLPQSWRDRLRAWVAGDAEARLDAPLLLQMTKLNSFLDRHFRSKDQRVLLKKR